MTLRSKLIRLAHAKPELRSQILPLLGTGKNAGVPSHLHSDWREYEDQLRPAFGLIHKGITDYLHTMHGIAARSDLPKEVTLIAEQGIKNAEKQRNIWADLSYGLRNMEGKFKRG